MFLSNNRQLAVYSCQSAIAHWIPSRKLHFNDSKIKPFYGLSCPTIFKHPLKQVISHKSCIDFQFSQLFTSHLHGSS